MGATLEYLTSLQFVPHGHCYLWTPSLLLLHAGSDALIASAYLIIPITLGYVWTQRKDLPFSWMFVLFSIFIVACGATHVMAIWNVWNANYWISGGVKLVTAIASVPTAYLLIRLIPRIKAIPTEQQLAVTNRRLESALEELEQFMFAVSHDLRAPLRSLDGFSQAVHDRYGDELDAQGRHYLDRIQAASRRMGLLIDSLLDLSRLSSQELRPSEIDVTALAESVAGECREVAADRDIRIRIEPGMRARADRELLRLALANLLGNAIKFTARRECAEIEMGTAQGNGETIFYVRDNGAGFDDRHAARLFTVFQRLHSDEEFEGTGVGLATVQRVIARHGGRIWAESPDGRGATFFFTLGAGDGE